MSKGKKATRKTKGATQRNSGRLSNIIPPKARSTKNLKEIKVAIAGVGNVASAFVQAVYCKELKGAWHERIGGYETSMIKVVAAFDVDKRKVGKDLSEAIFSPPNVCPRYLVVPRTGIVVQPGIVNYEIPRHVTTEPVGAENFVDLLKRSGAEILLSLIPSGMPDTTFDYAEAALKAGCSFVNGSPAPAVSDNSLLHKFEAAKLLLIGDDILSQFGGTAFHKGILDFMNGRGVIIEKSYQLDVGGGAETLNTINEKVKLEKRKIKTESISEELPYKFQTVAGTTDYVDYMGNKRTSYFWIQGKTLFDSEVKIDVYLRTHDAANACNVLLDVVRAVAKAKEQRRYGSPGEICDYGFKKPSEPALLRRGTEEFLKRYA
jgi:myo-inositol-1-phosphate synthase